MRETSLRGRPVIGSFLHFSRLAGVLPTEKGIGPGGVGGEGINKINLMLLPFRVPREIEYISTTRLIDCSG